MCQVCETKFGTFNATLSQRARRHWSTSKTAYDRRYTMRDWDKASRLYINIDQSVFGELSFRQQINAARKMIEDAFPEFKGKLRFSTYAGCSSCPCSPGFIVNERMTDSNRAPLDFDVKMVLAA
jgi:hypothetical protein